MSDTILKTDGISKSFGGVRAVQDFSMEMESGEVVGIIGPNGAGKTTIFNLLSCVYNPDEGGIVFAGHDISKSSQTEAFRLGMSRTFQNTRLFSGLSVLDNVKAALDYSGRYSLFDAMFLTPRRFREEKRISGEAMNCLEVLELSKYARLRPGSLPYGIQRRVEIARAIASRPKLLLLDEPAAGLNPEELLALIDFIADIKKKFDLSILIIEHRMDVIMSLCGKIYVQNFGKTIASGAPSLIQTDPAVLTAYIGEEE